MDAQKSIQFFERCKEGIGIKTTDFSFLCAQLEKYTVFYNVK
jgi:hypothetical protein